MKAKISFRALSLTLIIALVASYVLCIAGHLVFGWEMYLVWQSLLPGFVWPLTGAGFFIGLVWLVAYSLYIAALIAFPDKYFVAREG